MPTRKYRGFIQGHLINQIIGILEGTLNQIRDISNIRGPGPNKCVGVCKADALLENTCVGYALYIHGSEGGIDRDFFAIFRFLIFCAGNGLAEGREGF